jgi:GxxExxY protein
MQDSYNIIGACMKIHKELEKGFSEIIYGDTLEIELKKLEVLHKGEKLSHYYFADLVINSKIIIEIKAIECLINNPIKQTLNYLVASKIKLRLLVNFGEDSLTYKKVVL